MATKAYVYASKSIERRYITVEQSHGKKRRNKSQKAAPTRETSNQRNIYKENEFVLSKWVILRIMGFIYLSAFTSFYVQIPGLYGDNGVFPVNEFYAHPSVQASNFPTFLPALAKATQSDPVVLLHAVTLVGMVLSAIVVLGVSWSPILLLCWIINLTIFDAGQLFKHFQWDVLLLESGFLAIFLAPLFSFTFTVKSYRVGLPKDLGIWLFRWLLFRLMFASGVVKLSSMCPTWWSLTALDYHYWTQCIPGPLAWYIHNYSAAWFSQLSVFLVLVVELFVPFWIFGSRTLRNVAGILNVIFQVSIVLTGNYNIFNINTIALCIALFDDKFLSQFFIKKSLPGLKYDNTPPNEDVKSSKGEYKKWYLTVFDVLVFIVGIAVTVYLIAQMWKIDLNKDGVPISIKYIIQQRDWQAIVSKVTPWTIYIGIASGVWYMLANILSLVNSNLFNTRIGSKDVVVLLFGIIFACLLFTASIRPFTEGITGRMTPDIPTQLVPFEKFASSIQQQYYLSGRYGLFARMTTTRPEIIIEGSVDGKTWKEYEFKYKVGSLNRPAPWVMPHHPYLDWQMWFAALSNMQRNRWFARVLVRIVQNEPTVLSLLDSNPFEKSKDKPKFVRSKVFEYSFTSVDEQNKTGDFWKRTYKGDYTKSVSLEVANKMYPISTEQHDHILKRIHSNIAPWAPFAVMCVLARLLALVV